MQRKILNTKKVRSGFYIQNGQEKLHSIPIIKMKSNVLYSISCEKSCARFCRKAEKVSPNSNPTHVVWWRSPHCRSNERRDRTRASHKAMTPLSRVGSWAKLAGFAFLLVGMLSLMSTNPVSAADSASLTLGNAELSTTATQGSTAYLSSTITATANDAESYTLTIDGPTSLSGGSEFSGASNNRPSTMPNNSWGYAYDDNNSNENKTYKSFTGSAQTLESGTTPSGTAKNITFAAKFADNATPGHYTAKVNVSLVATPRVLGLWTLANGSTQNSGITTMQQMTPEICNQVATPTAVATPGGTKAPTMQLKDTRDDNIYSIAKFPDGRCWMQENLRLMGGNGLKQPLSADNSDGEPATNWTMPASSLTGFSDRTASNAYLGTPNSETGKTGYYTWCAATAGTCSSAVEDGDNAPSSICARGWKLPTGRVANSNTVNDFYNLFYSMELSVKGSLSDSSTAGLRWQDTGDVNIVKASPYFFTYTGYIGNSGQHEVTSSGYWWSRTAISKVGTNRLRIDDSDIYPGAYNGDRNLGFTVRCIADNAFNVTYIPNHPTDSSLSAPSSSSCAPSGGTCQVTLQPRTSLQSMPYCPVSGYDLEGWDTSPSATAPAYPTSTDGTSPTASITGNLTLYGVWKKHGGISAC